MTVIVTLFFLYLFFFKQKQWKTRRQAIQTKHLNFECRQKCFPGNNEAKELCIRSELIYLKYNIWLCHRKSRPVPTAKSVNVIFLHCTEFTITYTLLNLHLSISFTLTVVQNLSSSNFYIQSKKQTSHASALVPMRVYDCFLFEILLLNNKFQKM